MASSFQLGDCVRLPDGRIGRIRARRGAQFKVRVRRESGESHQFVVLPLADLKRVECPKGWMSPAGYRRYLRPTLKKMRERISKHHKRDRKR